MTASAQGGQKVAFGNTWVIAAIVVRLSFCPSPVALPVLFRLWRGKGTASQVDLAAGMVKLLAAAFPGRDVHGTGDAAFHGQALVVEGTTRTTRLPANAVLYGPEPPRTGKRGRPRVKGDRLGTLRPDRGVSPLDRYGDQRLRTRHRRAVTHAEALWHGSFKTAPGRVVLIRAPGSPKAYDLGLFTLDTDADPAAIAERYSWRWPIEPSNATGKQILGAGDACNRVRESRRAHRPLRVPHPVPADLLVCTLGLRPRRHQRAAPVGARGTAPRPARHPPTCSPGCAGNSSQPEFPPPGQASPTLIKSARRPGPAPVPPRNSETRGSRQAPRKN